MCAQLTEADSSPPPDSPFGWLLSDKHGPLGPIAQNGLGDLTHFAAGRDSSEGAKLLSAVDPEIAEFFFFPLQAKRRIPQITFPDQPRVWHLGYKFGQIDSTLSFGVQRNQAGAFFEGTVITKIMGLTTNNGRFRVFYARGRSGNVEPDGIADIEEMRVPTWVR